MNVQGGKPLLDVETAEVNKLLGKVKDKLSGGSNVFRMFAAYMRTVTDNTFRRLRRGGIYRGVKWSYFSNQYTRKTDGVTVPAWGGVPRLKKKKLKSGKGFYKNQGKVKGRLRPSGTRVKQGDSVVQDLGTLRARAALVGYLGDDKVTMGPQGVTYAAAQQRMRPFIFFEVPKDASQLLAFALKEVKSIK